MSIKIFICFSRGIPSIITKEKLYNIEGKEPSKNKFDFTRLELGRYKQVIQVKQDVITIPLDKNGKVSIVTSKSVQSFTNPTYTKEVRLGPSSKGVTTKKSVESIRDETGNLLFRSDVKESTVPTNALTFERPGVFPTYNQFNSNIKGIRKININNKDYAVKFKGDKVYLSAIDKSGPKGRGLPPEDVLQIKFKGNTIEVDSIKYSSKHRLDPRSLAVPFREALIETLEKRAANSLPRKELDLKRLYDIYFKGKSKVDEALINKFKREIKTNSKLISEFKSDVNAREQFDFNDLMKDKYKSTELAAEYYAYKKASILIKGLEKNIASGKGIANKSYFKILKEMKDVLNPDMPDSEFNNIISEIKVRENIKRGIQPKQKAFINSKGEFSSEGEFYGKGKYEVTSGGLYPGSLGNKPIIYEDLSRVLEGSSKANQILSHSFTDKVAGLAINSQPVPTSTLPNSVTQIKSINPPEVNTGLFRFEEMLRTPIKMNYRPEMDTKPISEVILSPQIIPEVKPNVVITPDIQPFIENVPEITISITPTKAMPITIPNIFPDVIPVTTPTPNITRNITQTPGPTPNLTTIKRPPYGPVLLPSSKVVKKIIKSKSPLGYEVLIRRRGKYYKESPFALPKEEAMKFGIKRTLASPAATFKLVPTSKRARSLGLTAPSARELGLYRAPKSRAELTFIQKERSRILTAGEKRGISYKGTLAAASKKNARRRATMFKRRSSISLSPLKGGKTNLL